MGGKQDRVDPNFAKLMRDIMSERVFKKLQDGVHSVERGLPEATRLLMKTEGFKVSIQELKTKPKNYKF